MNRISTEFGLPGARRFAALGLICLSGLMLSGCFLCEGRAPGNRPIWKARLPHHDDFGDVVIVLDGLPRFEFAFLLAQHYPESYVVAAPRGTKASPHRGYLSEIETERPWFHESGGRGIRVLPPYLVFHRMQMTPVRELPMAVSGGPVVRLAWGPSITGPPPNEVLSTLTVVLPMLLTLGLAWPPPVPADFYKHPAEKGQALRLTFDSGEEVVIKPNKGADRWFISGGLWSLPLAPFLELNSLAYIEPMDRSPGVWADCLEQAFAHERVLEVSRAVTATGRLERAAWFASAFEAQGYHLERFNPLEARPGFCALRDASDPNGEAFFWARFDKEGNHLR